MLESGEGFEVGASTESEGSEDGVGYEGYFFDGTGRGGGEGAGGISTGGMSLTGEYRGWSTLEAWADRSVRRWQQMGLVPDPPTQDEKGKAPEKVGLGVLDLANANASSGAEVPIPVLADVSNATPSRHSGKDGADPQETSQKESVPTISITKPPAPLPVDLPTHDEITPPSPDFESRPDDIESGDSLMREVGPHSRTATDLSSTGLQQDVSSSPKSSQTSLSGYMTPSSSSPTASSPRLASLLGDPTSTLGASSKKPSLSARRSPRVTPLELRDETPPISGDESDAESGEVTATVRLVGSGTGTGAAHDEAQ